MKRKHITYRNRGFYVLPEVYEPSDDTFLLASSLLLKEGDKVLDVGTGCGILAILAAEKASGVIAIDINPYAVECTRLNITLNNCSNKVEVRHGNLFDPLSDDEKFHLMIFNPPYLPQERASASWLERAWDGGASGRKWIGLFLEECTYHLYPHGRMLLVQSSLSQPEATIRKLAEKGFKIQIHAEKKLDFERIFVLHAILKAI